MTSQDTPPSTPHIAVFGLGYVGCVTAACFARLGLRVSGIDKDENKVGNILRGFAPFYEPGLEEIVKETVSAGLLTATTSTADGIADADVALICVGTPSERNGNLGLDQVRRVVAEIAAQAAGRTKPLVVAMRSTVFPGTCEDVVIPAFAGMPHVSVVSNPEFLREGVAVKDFLEPSLIVVGGADQTAVDLVARIYAPLNVKVSKVTLRTAEMIKYACNAFHAVKIAFANEIGSLSACLGIPSQEVMATLCEDTKLNASAAYLKPGFAFGGSCLPKDLRALNYRASRLDLKLPLLSAALPSNESHLDRATRAALDLKGPNIGVIGLAFKENTDDLRESPVINLLESLIGKGRDLRVFDPHIKIDEIYGSNKNYILNAIPHIGRLMESSIDSVISWADNLVVTQKLAPALAAKVAASGKPVLDLASNPPA